MTSKLVPEPSNYVWEKIFSCGDILADYIQLSTKWSKSPKKQSEWMHSKYSARKSKIRSYRLLLRRFCPLGKSLPFHTCVKTSFLEVGLPFDQWVKTFNSQLVQGR